MARRAVCLEHLLPGLRRGDRSRSVPHRRFLVLCAADNSDDAEQKTTHPIGHKSLPYLLRACHINAGPLFRQRITRKRTCLSEPQLEAILELERIERFARFVEAKQGIQRSDGGGQCPRHVEAHEEAGAIMVASGKAIFMGAGAIVNRSVAGVQLASVRLNEPEAKIEVCAAWRKDDDSPTMCDFLNCIRVRMNPQKQKGHAGAGRVINSHFPRAACDECFYARSTKTGR